MAKSPGRDAELPAELRDFLVGAWPAEFLVRGTEIDDLHLLRRHEPCVDDEVGSALRDGDGDVRVPLQQPIGDLLKPGRVRQIRVLMKDGRNAAHRGSHPPERRRAIPMEMEHIDLLPVDDFQQRRQRRRIELRFVQIGDVDAERVERFFGQVLLSEAHERHVKTRRIEARNHPCKQALDAVHARPFPAEMIADL